ncbi:MAG: hypothetical protein QGH06_07395 [Lutibacter sp.]|jgi:hypothetical protein|nr:hypothetical protein [Lutibacter sp.]
MNLPEFLLGDHTDHPDAIFVIHTQFPRFIINLVDDEIEWFEDFQGQDQEALTQEVASLIAAASDFYDREVTRYETS